MMFFLSQISNERIFVVSCSPRTQTPFFFIRPLFQSFPFFPTICSIAQTGQTLNKAFCSIEWKILARITKNIKRAFFMKIITFLQIVRSGKITASQKANLSINKRFLSINSKSAKNTSISKANVFQRNFEYTFDLKGNDQASPPCCCFLMDILENGSSCYGLEAEICISTDFQPCWGKCHGFKKQSDQLWGHDFFL